MLGRASFLICLLAGLLIVLLVGEAAWAADPFRGGGSAPMPSEGTAAWVPEFLQPLTGWLHAMQRRMMVGLQRDMAGARDGTAWAPMLGLVGGSFVYGVLHAAGPGHGKIVVGSYVLGRGARLRQALAMSGATALVQALSAIVLVGGFALVLDLGGRRLLAQASLLETASFALIAILGLSMLRRAIRNEGCGHDHGHGHVHHACAHHHHDHDHAHQACGHDHAPPPQQAKHKTPGGMELFLAAAAVGLRPCTGAILVLLFTFANGLVWLGIAATLAMGAGTALTVAGISLGAVGLRAMLERWSGGGSRAAWIQQGLAIIGAVLVTLLGISLFLASLSGTNLSALGGS